MGSQRELIRLHEILAKRFDAEELRTLCFRLGIDYDDLKGEGKLGKARELVAFLERYGRIGELVATGKQLRPDLVWDADDAAIPPPTLVQVFFHAAGIQQPDDEQREVLESYLESMARRCNRLRLAGVVNSERARGKTPAFTLSQVYITLAASAWTTVAEADDKDLLSADLEAGDPDAVLPQDVRRVVRKLPSGGQRSDISSMKYRLERPLLLTETLCHRRRMVLLGGPGSGKSAFLRYLMVTLARAEDEAALRHELLGWDAGLLLPIYASLGGFAAWTQQQGVPCNAAQLWRYLLATSETYPLTGLAQPLQHALRNGRLLLLLDGLDEVADLALRLHVAGAITALAEQHNGFVVVTCRVRSYVDDIAAALAEWGEPVELAPFMLGQIKHFVRGWYACAIDHGTFDDIEARRRAETLNERIDALQTLRDLGQTPLLLTIITILHYYEGKLPEDRADLYEVLVQLLLTRWTQQRREAGAAPSLLARLKADERLSGLKDFHIRNVLEDLAYRAHQSERSPDGRGLLDLSVVREALLKLFRQFDLGPGPANEKAELVLVYLEEESGLLLYEGGDRYGLPHLTYEEYLAGCYLTKQKSGAGFHPLAYRHWQADATRWREVIFLALGRMVRGDDVDTAARWLRFLLEPAHGKRVRDTTEQMYAALFAAECLEDIGGKPALIGADTVTLPGLWDDLAQALVRVIGTPELAAVDRVRTGCYLGQLGDPRPSICDVRMEMVPFVSGNFFIGNTWAERERLGALAPSHWLPGTANNQVLFLAGFELAHYPVTNAQFALFTEDDGYDCERPWWDDAARRWLRETNVCAPRSWDDPRFGRIRPNHPVVDISWYEATAFCRWLTQHPTYNPTRCTYRLPSEAEWEYAARGPARRPYPWGTEEPDYERANFGGHYKGTTAVGCFPQGVTPDGIHDMTGNVWEWTSSVYGGYPYDPADGRETPDDPAEQLFTVRGGGWTNLVADLHATFRDRSPPDNHYHGLGFRLARTAR